MPRAVLGGLFLSLALVMSTSSLRAQTLSPVELDWSDVSDTHVNRCGLSRLRGGTLERLVDEGHAVVDAAGSSGIRVRVSSIDTGLRIVVSAEGVALDETLPVPKACDATFVLEAISKIIDLVGTAQERSPERSAERGDAGAPPKATVPDGFRLSVEGVLKAADPGSFLLFGVNVGAQARAAAGWHLGARMEVTGNRRLTITVIEPAAFASAIWEPDDFPLGVVLEAGPLLHLANSAELGVRELDGLLAAGLRLGTGHFVAEVLAYGRLRRFEHRIDGQTAFDTRHVGLILRLGAQLFDG